MRSTIALGSLVLAACWNGEEALHKPCGVDDHCGRMQSCMTGFCDGPPDTAADESSTGGSCNPPPAMGCDPNQQVDARSPVARELFSPSFGRATALAAAELVGDPMLLDLAVLSYDNYDLVAMENLGSSWTPAGSYGGAQLTDLMDLVAVDLDRNGTTEFLMLSFSGSIEVVSWDGSAFVFIALLDLQATDLLSFAAVDVVGDTLVDLVASSSTEVYLLQNMGGTLLVDNAMSVQGEFAQPWDTLVVGAKGSSQRILVPESNNTSTAGVANQQVGMLRIEGLAPVLQEPPFGRDFVNPWALAEGDFLGGDELEIVVAERRLNQPVDTTPDGSTDPGRLRFFRLVGDTVTEVGEPLEIGVGPAAFAAADLDCDGKSDLVIGNSGTRGADDARAQVLFGSCESSASADNLMTFPDIGDSGLSAGSRLAVGDFDNNGLVEVAIPDAGDRDNPDDTAQRVVFVSVEEAQ